jgi:hypothetical protein
VWVLASCNDCDLPIDLPDSEKLVRVVKTPHHFHRTRKTEIIAKALYPPPENSDVSVIRHLLGDEACRSQALKTARPDEYAGLFVLRAGDARSAGSEAYDHRSDFCGHAHINHGVVMPPRGETMDPMQSEKLSKRCKALLAFCTFHKDTHGSDGQEIVGSL